MTQPPRPTDPRARLEVLADVFADASPAQLAERELQRRFDTKYVVPVTMLAELLVELGPAYAAARSRCASWLAYQTTYFDTPALQCFHDHRRGRRVRHKIRIRHYSARAMSFLELKTKHDGQLTIKQRLALTWEQSHLAEPERAFLRERVGTLADEVGPVLRIDYRRLSLVGLAAQERVTIDVGIEYTGHAGTTSSLDAVAIIEVKRPALSIASPMAALLARAGHRSRAFSKYVVAIARLHPDIPHNRLRPNLGALARIGR